MRKKVQERAGFMGTTSLALHLAPGAFWEGGGWLFTGKILRGKINKKVMFLFLRYTLVKRKLC